MIFASFIGMPPFVYHMHGDWNKVNSRTIKLCMFCFTEFAFKDFELVNYVFIFISEIGIDFIVHLRLFEAFHATDKKS